MSIGEMGNAGPAVLNAGGEWCRAKSVGEVTCVAWMAELRTAAARLAATGESETDVEVI